MSRSLKNSILLVIVVLNILAAIINIPNIVLKFSYTKNFGTVENTYTQFSFYNIGYDSMVTFNYVDSNNYQNKTCFYRSCFGCPTYQIANLTSFSYKLNNHYQIWTNNENSQDCYTYDKSKTKIQKMPLLFVIFDFILITLFIISMIIDYKNIRSNKTNDKNKNNMIEVETANPL